MLNSAFFMDSTLLLLGLGFVNLARV